MTARRLLSGLLVVSEEDEEPPARRSRRDWVVDSSLFLLAAAAGGLALADQVGRGLDGPLLVFDVIGGAALCLALWWRRRWPFGLGLASVPIVAFSSSAGFAGLIVLFTVAAYRRWQLAFLVAALQLAMFPVYRAVQPDDDALPPLAFFVIQTLAYAAIVAWGMFIRGRRQSRRERVRHAEAEQELRVEQIRYAERTRIAREMHDVLAHRISLLSLHAGALEFRPDAPPEEVARAAAVIRASAHQALEDLRAVIGVLRDGSDGERAAAAPADAGGAARAARGVTRRRDAPARRRAPRRPGRRPGRDRAPRAADRPGGADERAQARDVGRGRPPHRGRAGRRADDRGAQPGAGSGRRRAGDPRGRDRPRRPRRAGDALRRPARARTRRGGRLPAARLVAVADT